MVKKTNFPKFSTKRSRYSLILGCSIAALAPFYLPTAKTVAAEIGLVYATCLDHYARYKQEEKVLQATLTLVSPDYPRFPIILNQWGLLQKNLGNYISAEKAYRKCIELDSVSCSYNSHRDTYTRNLAIVLQEEGKLEEAENKLLEVIAAHRGSQIDAAIAYNSLASIYRQQGKLSKAANLWKKCIEIVNSTEAGVPYRAIFASNLSCVERDLGLNRESSILQNEAEKLASNPLTKDEMRTQIALNKAICMYNDGLKTSQISELTSSIKQKYLDNFPSNAPAMQKRIALIENISK